jgi:hypothetical protein
MPIKSNLEKHTVSWLHRQDTDGNLNKNISIQRKEVWDAEKKSNLIVSLLMDIPIESLLFEEAENNSFNVLDGKQRTLTLCSFVSDKFSLSPKIRIKELDGQFLANMTFLDLPVSMRNKILEYELSISILRPLVEDERATVFFMRNQAVSLSKIDLSLVVLGERAMNILAGLCEHDFMLKKIKLTMPARRKHDDLRILLQYIILRLKPDMGFSGTEIMNLCDDIKNEEVAFNPTEIENVLDYLSAAFLEKKNYLKKVHVPIVMYTARAAKEKGMSPEDFHYKLEQFFEHLDSNGEYMSACKSGSAKRASVQLRIKIMGEILHTPSETKPVPDAESRENSFTN